MAHRWRAKHTAACNALECVRDVVASDRDKHEEQSAEWRRLNAAVEIADKALGECKEGITT